MQRVVLFAAGAVASMLFGRGHATDSGFVVTLMVMTAGAAIWPRALAPWLVVTAIVIAAGFSISGLFTFDFSFDLESPEPPPINHAWWSVLACVVLAVAGGIARAIAPRNLDIPSIPPAQARR